MGAEASVSAIAPAAPARSGRFVSNLITNVGQLGLSLAVGVFYVPFLVRHLGAAVYGLVPLISMVTSYMALITMGLDSAVARHMTLALNKKDDDRANLVFNVSIWGNLALDAVLLLPAIAGVVYVDRILRIPPGYETATRWLFAGTVAAFLLNQIRTPFSISSFCMNRLDLQNGVTACETFTRVGLVVALFYLVAPRIEYVGLAIFAGTMVSTVGTIWLWRVLTPKLRVRLRQFDWKLLKDLCGTGGWVMVSRVGMMLYLNIDMLMANRLFGPDLGGRYAAVLLVPTLLRSGSYAVGGIFPPTMYEIYARGNTDELVSYLNNAIKFLGLVMALVIGLVCGFSEPLLKTWLGPEFEHLGPLLILMVVHLSLSLSMYPVYAVPLAADRVRAQGLVALAVGVGNFLLALLLAKTCGWGLYGLAAAGAIMLTIRYFVFTPMYAARILNRPWGTFYRSLPSIVLTTAVTVLLGRLIQSQWPISNWIELGTAAATVTLAFSALVYLLLTPRERTALRDVVVRFRGAV